MKWFLVYTTNSFSHGPWFANVFIYFFMVNIFFKDKNKTHKLNSFGLNHSGLQAYLLFFPLSFRPSDQEENPRLTSRRKQTNSSRVSVSQIHPHLCQHFLIKNNHHHWIRLQVQSSTLKLKILTCEDHWLTVYDCTTCILYILVVVVGPLHTLIITYPLPPWSAFMCTQHVWSNLN